MYTHSHVTKYRKTVFSRQIRLETPIAVKWWENEKNQINVSFIRETFYKLAGNLF